MNNELKEKVVKKLKLHAVVTHNNKHIHMFKYKEKKRKKSFPFWLLNVVQN